MSVRGWLGDIVTTGESYVTVGKVDAAMMRAETLRNASVYVEGVRQASGGLSEWGSFIILDVPPGKSKIVFQIPGVGDAALQLDQVPSNADVLIPSIRVEAGRASVPDASKIVVRVPGKERKEGVGAAIIGGQKVAVRQVLVSDLEDRRDFPVPSTEAAPKPIAIVK